MLTLKQQAKWQELNTFFKTNSKYYKKIDNDNIIFNTWAQGAGGDFLSTLFLDSMLDIDEVEFITYNNIGVSDYYEYKYKVKSFHKIIEFNGSYVIKFKADVTVDGKYLLENYVSEELNEKYKNKLKK